jgi:plasmid stability protein
MPALYVENVPGALYEALRARAKVNRRSIAAETIVILQQLVTTPEEKEQRAAFYERLQTIRSQAPQPAGGPSAEELLREDRSR